MRGRRLSITRRRWRGCVFVAAVLAASPAALQGVVELPRWEMEGRHLHPHWPPAPTPRTLRFQLRAARAPARRAWVRTWVLGRGEEPLPPPAPWPLSLSAVPGGPMGLLVHRALQAERPAGERVPDTKAQ